MPVLNPKFTRELQYVWLWWWGFGRQFHIKHTFLVFIDSSEERWFISKVQPSTHRHDMQIWTLFSINSTLIFLTMLSVVETFGRMNELWYMLVPTLSWMSKVNVLMQFEKWNSSRPCYEESVNMIINSVDIFLISHTMNWLLNVIMTSFSMSHFYHEKDNAIYVNSLCCCLQQFQGSMNV